MPISPENMALYPGGSIHSPEWQAIRAYIRARAGDRCEECGVKNGAHGARHIVTSIWLDSISDLVEFPHFDEATGITAYHVQPAITIVCTVAHLDHDPAHNHESNLRFLCQLHHNRHDAEHRRTNRAAR